MSARCNAEGSSESAFRTQSSRSPVSIRSSAVGKLATHACPETRLWHLHTPRPGRLLCCCVQRFGIFPGEYARGFEISLSVQCGGCRLHSGFRSRKRVNAHSHGARQFGAAAAQTQGECNRLRTMAAKPREHRQPPRTDRKRGSAEGSMPRRTTRRTRWLARASTSPDTTMAGSITRAR